MKPAPQIAIIGATLCGNRGAEAMAVTTIATIRKNWPDSRFQLFSYFPQQDRRLALDDAVEVIDARPVKLVLVHFPWSVLCWLLGLLRLRLPDMCLPYSVRHLRNCAVLIDLMGISFADGREKFLPFNILSIWPAMLLKVPVVKLSQAMGPFEHWLTRVAASRFLPKCRHVVARGETTAQYLTQLNALPTDRWSIASDLAFLYEPGFSLSQENDDRWTQLAGRLNQAREQSKRVVGVSPSSVVHGKFLKMDRDYIGFVVDLITRIAQEGHEIVVLPNATREGHDGPRNNDLFIMAQVKKQLRMQLAADLLSPIHWLDFDANTCGIRAVIQQCDVLITSRFHAMIAALSLAVPVLVVGWSHKYDEVLAMFGLERFAIDFSAVGQDLITRLDELLEHNDEIRRAMTQKLPSVQDSSRKQFSAIDSILS